MAGDYVQMATLKGVPHWRVVLCHALPDALLPAINVIAMAVAWLLGGVVLVEVVFNHPGIGRRLVDAISDRDLPVVQAITMIVALTYILDLPRDLTAARNMAMVCVSHDPGVIARVCDRVQVLYAGETVLEGPVRAVLQNPAHPYARGRLAATPRLGDRRLPRALDGRPPMIEGPQGQAKRCLYPDRVAGIAAQATGPALPLARAPARRRCTFRVWRFATISLG